MTSLIIDIPKITVTVRSGHISLEPIRVGKLKAFGAALEPMITDMFAVMESQDNSALVALVTKHAGSVVDLVALVTGKDKKDVDDFLLDELVEVVGGILEINADFFAKSLMPVIGNRAKSLKDKMAALSTTTGQTDSNA